MSMIRKLGRVFRRRSPKKDVGISSSAKDSSAPGPRQDSSKATSNYDPPKVNEKSDSGQSLWDCAYDALKLENPELVLKYETLLSIELSKKCM
jgi:hypothetical protein